MVFAVLGGIISGLSAVLTALGPAVSAFRLEVLPKIAATISVGLEAFRALGGVAQEVLRAMGVLNRDETLPDLGDRALQAAASGLKPGDCHSTKDYLDRLRAWRPDAEASASTPESDKIAAGLAVGSLALEEKFSTGPGSMGDLWVLAALSPSFFTGERLSAFLQATPDPAAMIEYFSGNLDVKTARAVEGGLVEAERKLSPEKLEAEIRQNLGEAAEAIRSPAAAG